MWDRDEMIVFWFDRGMSAEDRQALLDALRSPDVGVADKLSGGAFEPTEIEAYIVLAKTTLSITRVVAQRIVAWRNKTRQRNKATLVRIERPGRAPINLTVASDEEINIFITDGRQPG